jgi:hypothetical protein
MYVVLGYQQVINKLHHVRSGMPLSATSIGCWNFKQIEIQLNRNILV